MSTSGVLITGSYLGKRETVGTLLDRIWAPTVRFLETELAVNIPRTRLKLDLTRF